MSYCYPDKVNVIKAEPDKITVLVDKDSSGRTVRTYIYHGWPVLVQTLAPNGDLDYQDYPHQVAEGALKYAVRRAGLEFEEELGELSLDDYPAVEKLTDEEVHSIWHGLVYEDKYQAQGYGFCELEEIVNIDSKEF